MALRAEKPSEAFVFAKPAERAPAASVSILVVDDIRDNRTVISLMLSMAGYDVDSVEDANAALDAIKHRHYDLILMDVMMPVCGGVEATSLIRDMGLSAEILPILGLSASVAAGTKAECLTAGMQDCLPKPITFEHLTAKVEQWTLREAA